MQELNFIIISDKSLLIKAYLCRLISSANIIYFIEMENVLKCVLMGILFGASSLKFIKQSYYLSINLYTWQVSESRKMIFTKNATHVLKPTCELTHESAVCVSVWKTCTSTAQVSMYVSLSLRTFAYQIKIDYGLIIN